MSHADYHFGMKVLHARVAHGAALFCPIEDEPLPEDQEKEIDSVGPHRYLAWLCAQAGNSVPDLSPLTEAQARRTVRKAVRLTKDPKRFMN